jgi:hypothetical protein
MAKYVTPKITKHKSEAMRQLYNRALAEANAEVNPVLNVTDSFLPQMATGFTYDNPILDMGDVSGFDGTSTYSNLAMSKADLDSANARFDFEKSIKDLENQMKGIPSGSGLEYIPTNVSKPI